MSSAAAKSTAITVGHKSALSTRCDEDLPHASTGQMAMTRITAAPRGVNTRL